MRPMRPTRKTLLAALVLPAALALLAPAPSSACTNFLITNGASEDGSTMITYAADSHVLYGELYFTPAASHLNFHNRFLDAQMNRVEIATVQQVADRAFYRKGSRWVDSRIVDRSEQARPQQVVEFGSEAFMQLARRLADENRQGTIMMQGEIMLMVDGRRVLVRNTE